MSDDKKLDLRGSIRDLRKVAKTLDAVNFNFKMDELEKFLNGIKIDKPAKPPEDLLKPLLAKFLHGVRDFSSRELRALPFIIYEPPITYNDTITILNKLDFLRTSQLRGLLSVYLLNYDNSNKTELLRQRLNNVRNVEAVSLKKIFASKDKLFGNERFTNMAKLFVQKLSVNDSLETIGLSDFCKTSNFIQASLKNFFRPNVASLSAQMKLLTELNAEYDTAYKNIFPAIADSLIQTVYHAGYFKEQCIEIFYSKLGDPRFGNSRFKWDTVSQKSKDIFCHWLSEEDLEIFFKIVQATALDKQWKYREIFWRAYLPHIVKTKIFLGSDARNIAAGLEGVKLHHGDLLGAQNNQSVFVFQIGRYIFSEWSHNGSLRIYQEDKVRKDITILGERNFFEYNSINRFDLTENAILKNIKHSSPKTYFWQHQVSEWIEENCGIYKTQKDWARKQLVKI